MRDFYKRWMLENIYAGYEKSHDVGEPEITDKLNNLKPVNA